MTTTGRATDEFEARVLAGGGRAEALGAAAALRAGDLSARHDVAALALHVAVVAPERVVDVYDGLTEGWLGAAPDGPAVSGPSPAPSEVSDRLWAGLWDLVFDPDAGRDPADITVRTAALTEFLTPEFHRRVAAMALRYPGVAESAAGGSRPGSRSSSSPRAPRTRSAVPCTPSWSTTASTSRCSTGTRSDCNSCPRPSTTATCASCSATTSGTWSPATPRPGCTRCRCPDSRWPSSATSTRRCSSGCC